MKLNDSIESQKSGLAKRPDCHSVVILRDEGLKNISGSPELCSSFSVALQTSPTATVVFPDGLRK